MNLYELIQQIPHFITETLEKNEEEKLSYDFDSKLNIPGDKYGSGARASSPRGGANRSTGGKKKPAQKGSGSSPGRTGGASTTSGAKTSHKNKKTTK